MNKKETRNEKGTKTDDNSSDNVLCGSCKLNSKITIFNALIAIYGFTLHAQVFHENLLPGLLCKRHISSKQANGEFANKFATEPHWHMRGLAKRDYWTSKKKR